MSFMIGSRLCLLFLFAALLPKAVAAQTAPAPAPKAIVVELFTAEGCSSCPPADNLLAQLRQVKVADGVVVIPLGLHVDYWNNLGWIDRFSSAAYTERQQRYAEKMHLEGPYTPQMVVNGVVQFVGNDVPRARDTLLQAASQPSSASVQIIPAGEGKFQVTVKGAEGNGDVMLAVTEDNLSTKVSGGENANRELRHSAVVRELRSIGHLRNGSFDDHVTLNLKKDWKRDDLRVVVFVQQSHNGAIQGAATLGLAEKTAAAR